MWRTVCSCFALAPAAFGLSLLGRIATPTPSVVLFGQPEAPGRPATREVQLCAAKLAAKAGMQATVVVNSSEVERATRLMYGNARGSARVVAARGDIMAALSACEAIVLAYDGHDEVSETSLSSMIEGAPKLKHVALLSRIGQHHCKTEERVRRLCGTRAQLSLVRVGRLRGGGPGHVATSGARAGTALTDHGLSKAYYDSINHRLAHEAMCYDRFTLGAVVLPGNPLQPPLIEPSTASVTPYHTDVNRIAAAGALVAAVRRRKGGEFTVSADASTVPPDPATWIRMLDGATNAVSVNALA